jgi:hypothetical protein
MRSPSQTEDQFPTDGTEVTARACDRKGTDIADLLPAHGWRNSFAKTPARAAIEGLTGALGL